MYLCLENNNCLHITYAVILLYVSFCDLEYCLVGLIRGSSWSTDEPTDESSRFNATRARRVGDGRLGHTSTKFNAPWFVDKRRSTLAKLASVST